jgi:hypothetical protein
MDQEKSREPSPPPEVESGRGGLDGDRTVAPPSPPGGGSSDGPVPSAVIRTAGLVAVTAAVVLAAVSIAASAVGAALDIAAGEGFSPADTFRVLALWAALAAALAGCLAVLLLRAAHAGRPVTPPPGKDEPVFRAISASSTMELGETGIRFPWALPVSLAGATVGVFFLSLVLGNLRHDSVEPGIFVMGCCLSLVPLVAGVVWWPFLRRAMSGGIAARQLRLIGMAYLVAGVVGGLAGGIAALVASGAEGAFPGVFGIFGVGALLAWRGSVLSGLAKRAEQQGIARS